MAAAPRPRRARNRRLLMAGGLAYLITFLIILPLLWVGLLSFQSSDNILNHPFSFHSLSWHNYVNTFENVPLAKMYKNTVILASVSVTIGTVISFLSSFALTRLVFRHSRARTAARLYLLGGLAIPVYILLFPVYRLDITLHIFGHLSALILPYVAVTIPFNTLILTGFLRDFPGDLEEAAIIDGASLSRLIWSVVLPLMKPVLATIVIFNLIYVFNEFPFISILGTGSGLTTVSLAVSQFQGAYSTDYGGMMAATSVILLPQLAIYAIFQKQVVAGITLGAVKG